LSLAACGAHWVVNTHVNHLPANLANEEAPSVKIERRNYRANRYFFPLKPPLSLAHKLWVMSAMAIQPRAAMTKRESKSKASSSRPSVAHFLGQVSLCPLLANTLLLAASATKGLSCSIKAAVFLFQPARNKKLKLLGNDSIVAEGFCSILQGRKSCFPEKRIFESL